MTAIRTPGEIAENVFLIDAVHEGIQGAHAVYLVKNSAGAACLIDGGTKSSALVIRERLIELSAWPPEKMIITHSHWDHAQGVPYLMEQSEKDGKPIEVLASEKGISYLADQSYNVVFGEENAPFLNVDVEGVNTVSDGDVVDLGSGTTLKIIATPGHMVDHISILDETSRFIFTGDAMGMKWADNLIVSNPNSTFFSESDFLSSVEKVKSAGIKAVCLGHFGCLLDDEGMEFLDQTVAMYGRWMEVLSQHEDRIDDVDFLTSAMLEKVYDHLPENFRNALFEPMKHAVDLAAVSYKFRRMS